MMLKSRGFSDTYVPRALETGTSAHAEWTKERRPAGSESPHSRSAPGRVTRFPQLLVLIWLEAALRGVRSQARMALEDRA
jgi:hypothetical protein